MTIFDGFDDLDDEQKALWGSFKREFSTPEKVNKFVVDLKIALGFPVTAEELGIGKFIPVHKGELADEILSCTLEILDRGPDLKEGRNLEEHRLWIDQLSDIMRKCIFTDK